MKDAVDGGETCRAVRMVMQSDQKMLNSIAYYPVKVSSEQTDEEVEMNLMAETSHLSEYRSVGMIMMIGR